VARRLIAALEKGRAPESHETPRARKTVLT